MAEAKENLSSDYDPAGLSDLLPVYYKRLFPYGLYYSWLNYGGISKTYFPYREFSFTLKDDVYIRYQSFASKEEMMKEIQNHNPYKIDIGAVYSYKPKDHRMIQSFKALEKELVFDIDMTDYDDIRDCCSGADICSLCWPLMTIAIEILDSALRLDFGFEHILFIYSGRRGIHCWVCDEDARKLTVAGRSAVAEYLSIVKGGDNQNKKVTLNENIHPSIQRAIKIVNQHFTDLMVKKQDFLSSEEKWNKVLSLVPDEDIRKQASSKFASLKNSEDRWQYLTDSIKNSFKKNSSKKLQHCVEEIMLQYSYPRLDVNVSIGLNHLLKSPFCVHPKTGRVCVPIAVQNGKVLNFDPMKVPTISHLCDQINKFDEQNDTDDVENETPNKKKIKDFKKTSLNQSITIFKRFLQKLDATWKGKLIEESDKSGTF